MEGDVSEWQRCRFPGIDVIGAAKLLSFHPLQTNEQGVVATFLFTDMLRGAPGEYTSHHTRRHAKPDENDR